MHNSHIQFKKVDFALISDVAVSLLFCGCALNGSSCSKLSLIVVGVFTEALNILEHKKTIS